MITNFTIPIHPVTKKNSQQIVSCRGRFILLPSKKYKLFERAVTPFLTGVKKEIGIICYPVNITAVFYVAKRLKYDLTNLLEAIDDAMVKAGLLADDNRDIIAGHDNSRVFYDKENPRIELTISKMDDYEVWRADNGKRERKLRTQGQRHKIQVQR